MPKIYKLTSRIWIDEYNVIYRKKGHREVVTSDGRVLKSPRVGEKIFLDGRGNGYLFA
ncbi:MAG: hypothetical protein PHO48_04850 [Candidatus Gracilibacteria bacterium]|nr:hypothetical protein [Candidatus Gracilibacteria bacterium]MDD5179380.1 hypothetical protein [Candidatus Gracilibacteria bacterium]